MSNKQAIEIIEKMIDDFNETERRWLYLSDNETYARDVLIETKYKIQSLPDTDEWISADNPPEAVQMKQILAYEIDERRWIITATFYDGNWLRDDNENICFFDFWKELPTPPIN